VPIQDKKIDQVRVVLEQRVSCSPYPFLQLGQRVRIRGGSVDIEGILVGRDSAYKLVISIELIQRSLAASVYTFDVEPVGSCSGKMVADSRIEWQPGFNPKKPASALGANQDCSIAAAQE
jgi:hypothetical protein